ncbi:hypothetical protein U1Q18_033508 [Sarracenia purpurea var. burkii]
MLSPPDSPKKISNPASNFFRSIFSYDGNVMLAAIISLLLVILFVLILHIYAKWFLVHARRRSSRSVSVSDVLGPARFHHFNTLTFETSLASSPTKGLEDSAIASIPQFVYQSDHHKVGLECVICLSVFEERETGRKLPKCGHGFHLECIDVWLRSHSTCPICRAPAVMAGASPVTEIESVQIDGIAEELSSEGPTYEEEEVEIVVIEFRNSNENDRNGDGEGGRKSGSSSSAGSSSSCSLPPQTAALGGSLKMMVSRNLSELKVHPSIVVSELQR